MPGVAVAWVIDSLNSRLSDQRDQLGLPPTEQRTDQRYLFGKGATGAGAAKPPDASPSGQSHQQSFGLIIGMVRGGKGGQCSFLGPVCEKPVAHRPGLGLNVRRGGLAPVRGQDAVGDPESLANPGNHFGFGAAVDTQAMVDTRRLHQGRPGRLGEQQEGKAVWPAGNGNANSLARRQQGVEIGGEAREETFFDHRTVRAQDERVFGGHPAV